MRNARSTAPAQHAAAQPLPDPSAPLVAVYAVLARRAAAGDAAAASRLYRDVQRCAEARQQARVITAIARNVPDLAGESAAVVMRGHEAEVHMLGDMRAFVNRSAGLCSGATRVQLDSLIPVMFTAAQLGDVAAINCYAGSGFNMLHGLIDHPEWLRDMRSAPQMVEYALRQGDWVAVELMHHAYAGVFRDTAAGQAVQPDRAMDYRYLRLERLGASGEFAQKLDRMLADATATLTRQQIADGDAWANDAYTAYFGGSSSNEVANGANICGKIED